MMSPNVSLRGFLGRAWPAGCALGLIVLAGQAGCGDGGAGSAAPPDAAGADAAGPDAGVPNAAPDAQAEPDLIVVGDDPSDQPLGGLAEAGLDSFKAGDLLFGTSYRLTDGLGPLYIRTSCAACHRSGGKGPGSVQKFQVVDATTRAAVTDAPEMAFGPTERPYAVAGAQKPLLAPSAALPGHLLVLSKRIGPSVMGRGYVEAILDSEIERVAAEQALRTDGIHGRINRVTYHSHQADGAPFPHALGETGLIGRFGLKARVATLDDFSADAFQGDMGLTSPLRPDETNNPEHVTDDDKPGPDLDAHTVATVASYVRTIAIPARDPAVMNGPGRALFDRALCSVCHVPTLQTRADHPVQQLAGIAAPVYTDLLLHDMGDALADYLTDESAGPRDWKTAPLIALRFQRSFLHDGRARTISEAISQHEGVGSEANPAVTAWKALTDGERALLAGFVLAL
jgi:CxxC motif-containing protein (DUF1111 family)